MNNARVSIHECINGESLLRVEFALSYSFEIYENGRVYGGTIGKVDDTDLKTVFEQVKTVIGEQ